MVILCLTFREQQWLHNCKRPSGCAVVCHRGFDLSSLLGTLAFKHGFPKGGLPEEAERERESSGAAVSSVSWAYSAPAFPLELMRPLI